MLSMKLMMIAGCNVVMVLTREPSHLSNHLHPAAILDSLQRFLLKCSMPWITHEVLCCNASGIIYYLFLINVSSTSFSLDNLICTRKRNTDPSVPVSCSLVCGTTKAGPGRACGCLRLLHFCCKLNIFIAMTRRVLKLQTTHRTEPVLSTRCC